MGRGVAAALCLLLLAVSVVAVPGTARAESPTLVCELRGGRPAEDGVYLLTMAPGGQLFSAFGHNGLYVRSPRHHVDQVYNFGVFDGRDPNLLVGFLQGTQQYFLGTRSFGSMEEFYAAEDRTVTMQRLELSDAQLDRLMAALDVAVLPENRAYRYHWSENNCSTRIRDLLDEVLGGELHAQHDEGAGVSLRSEVLRHVGGDLPVWFGLHYAMSYGAERELTHWETMFLPARLEQRLRVSKSDAGALVGSECLLRDGRWPAAAAEPPPRDGWLWLIGLGLAGLIGLFGWLAPRSLGGRLGLGLVLVVYGLSAAALGSLSVWLWSSSTLTIFWRNLALSQLSPATLLVTVAGILAMTRRSLRAAWLMAAALCLVSLLGLLLGLVIDQAVLGMAGLALPVLAAATVSLWRLARGARPAGEELFAQPTPGTVRTN